MTSLQNQHIPPPSLEQVHKLQLVRTNLVRFIDWKEFADVVRGCFVRVLLEMRADDRARDVADTYYVAEVKGAKKGPSYSGFSWDGVSTEWHIIIELPPCFRSSPNGNLVQLSSISNTAFKKSEYEAWIQMTKETPGGRFMTEAQIKIRLDVLHENYNQAINKKRAKKADHTDSGALELKDAKISTVKKDIEAKIRQEHLLLPSPDNLVHMKVSDLHEVERQCLELLQTLRSSLNERTKCRNCKNHVCSAVCYPCKHRVLCLDCANKLTHCPSPGCERLIEDRFEAFSV